MFTAWIAFLSLTVLAPDEPPSPPSTPRGIEKPIVQLSTADLPDGIEDEQAYAKWLADRTAALLDAADKTDDPRKRLEARLAASNWMLAAECEPPMSQWLHGIDPGPNGARVGELARRALGHLAIARTDSERYTEQDDYDGEAAFAFETAIETLEAFADALQACVMETADEKAEKSRRAARRLSEYLEDDRPQVAAAAVLWQGVLYGRADRLDRAMRMLPRSAAPPARETLRYSFFAKLLRCKYLAGRGSYATAWRLLLTLEEGSQEWFEDVRLRTEAGRSAMLMKFEICQLWSGAGDDEANRATRAWCDEILAGIREEHFPAGADGGLMRLATAAPMLVPMPDDQPGADPHPDPPSPEP